MLTIPIVSSTEVGATILHSRLTVAKANCKFNGYNWDCQTFTAQAEAAAELRLDVTLNAVLEPGETLMLHLPGFTGAAADGFPVYSASMFIPGGKHRTRVFDTHPYGCPTVPPLSAQLYRNGVF